MSDDEEIVYKGKSVGLYSYLTDLGYADFETFESETLAQGDQFQLHNYHASDKSKERADSYVSRTSTLHITDHDYRKLVTILSSQLLLKEDAHIVESLLRSNIHVCKQKPNYVLHVSIVFTCVLSSILMIKSKANFGLGPVQYFVPASFTAIFSCFSAWQFYKEFDENRRDYMFKNHINDLKKLCFNILKLLRFIKETEILSMGQAPVSDIGSALYVPSNMPVKNNLIDVDVSLQWKTLPNLRKCLSDTVEEVLNLLTSSINSLRKRSFDRDRVEDHLILVNCRPSPTPVDSYKPFLPSGEGCFVTLLDLKELTSKYLFVQSEYLRELAFIFLPVFWKQTLTNKNNKILNRNVFEMCTNLQKKLTDCSFKLMMQFNIHNVASTLKKVSRKPSSRSHEMREINELQSGIHNVFLLLYSALLRVRNLEDYLETTSEVSESSNKKDKLPLDVTKQLTVLKGDLISTVKCYNVLCQQITGASKNKYDDSNQDSENGSNMAEVIVKETGIAVGTSDFTVNSPDEVFLSVSDTKNVDGTPTRPSENVDDWCLEIKPQIPKSLLTELSQTLKSRKSDFIEREKEALKRKGLQDTASVSPSCDEDSDKNEDYIPRKQYSSRTKYKRHSAAYDFSHSSDSDDEMDPFESGAFLTKLKVKKYQSEPYSESDSSVLDDELINKTSHESEVVWKPRLSVSSVANLAALKSQMWGENKEECFSDGSNS